MLIIAIVPALVCLLGILIFALTEPGKPPHEIGRAMLWCGLLVTLFVLARHTVKLG